MKSTVLSKKNLDVPKV
jgi:serine/threonine protein phosphatase PrpC